MVPIIVNGNALILSWPQLSGLCMVLEAATADSSLMLEPMVEVLLNSLFPIVCQSIDYSNVNQMKSHNEVLRCIAVLAGSFMDKVVAFLMTRLQVRVVSSSLDQLYSF